MEQFGNWKLTTRKVRVCSPYLIVVPPSSSKVPSRLAPPWQGWEPDSKFLYELHKWNIDHKDDKLPAVLAKVNSILESKPLEAALGFIPDNPFPAKSLVKALVSLFLLGSVSHVYSQTPCHLPILIIHLENSSGEAGHL
jgi:hypothetical protein